MIKLLKISKTYAFAIISAIFTFVPEALLGKYKLFDKCSDEINIILIRVLVFIAIFILSIIVNAIYLKFRRKICIKGHNYSICIKYGDIFKMNKCKKVIPFDECYTTSVGNLPSDINPDSICGQYLSRNPIQDIQTLINNINLQPDKNKSKYKNKECYTSGKLVPNGNDLLLAFAKLDKDGLGYLTREEYLDSLSVLWKEIDKYYGQKDVCIPILGSGVTRINGTSFSQQELLDMIICSYKLSTNKIKNPYKLHIICKKRDDFSLNKIGESL